MVVRHLELALRRGDLLTLEGLASACSMHPELVTRLVEAGLVTPERRAAAGLLFRASTVLHVRKIQRLRQLGVNLAGIEIVLDLTERVRRLQRELEELRCRL